MSKIDIIRSVVLLVRSKDGSIKLASTSTVMLSPLGIDKKANKTNIHYYLIFSKKRCNGQWEGQLYELIKYYAKQKSQGLLCPGQCELFFISQPNANLRGTACEWPAKVIEQFISLGLTLRLLVLWRKETQAKKIIDIKRTIAEVVREQIPVLQRKGICISKSRDTYVTADLRIETKDSRFDPKKITMQLKVSPDYSGCKGVKVLEDFETKVGNWGLKSNKRKSATLKTHIQSIYKRVSNVHHSIFSLSKKYSVCLDTVVTPHKDTRNPHYHFSVDLLQPLVEMGAKLKLVIWRPDNK